MAYKRMIPMAIFSCCLAQALSAKVWIGKGSEPVQQQQALTVAYPANVQSDLNAQLDELARLDSKGWVVWSYRPGSMNNSRVTQISADGGTMVARGYYRYGGGSAGSVEVRFVNGRFSCIKFEDDSSCRNLYDADRSTNGKMTLAAAALAVTVVAMAGSSSSKEGYASNSYSSNVDSAGGGGSPSRQEDRRAQAKRSQQDNETTPRIGGDGGLYGCANPPCWDQQ